MIDLFEVGRVCRSCDRAGSNVFVGFQGIHTLDMSERWRGLDFTQNQEPDDKNEKKRTTSRESSDQGNALV